MKIVKNRLRLFKKKQSSMWIKKYCLGLNNIKTQKMKKKDWNRK